MSNAFYIAEDDNSYEDKNFLTAVHPIQHLSHTGSRWVLTSAASELHVHCTKSQTN